MSSISRVSLDDTLHVLQLVRETALARSRQAAGSGQAPAAEKMAGLAKQLDPVVNRMQELRTGSSVAKAEEPAAAPAGILGQADFQRLLQARKTAVERSAQMAQEAESGQQSAATLQMRTAQAFQSAQSGSVDRVQASGAGTGVGMSQGIGGTQPGASNPAYPAAGGAGAASLSGTLERNRMIAAMAAGNMNELDIARQFGLSREEVRLVLNRQQNSEVIQ